MGVRGQNGSHGGTISDALFLHVSPKGRLEPDALRFPGICPLSCKARDKSEGTNQRGQDGGHGDNLRHPSSFTYLPKPDAMRLPGICPRSVPSGTNLSPAGSPM